MDYGRSLARDATAYFYKGLCNEFSYQNIKGFLTTFLLTQLQRFFFKSLKVRRLPVPTVKNQQTTTFPFIVALFYPFRPTLHLATFRPFCRQFRSFLHTLTEDVTFESCFVQKVSFQTEEAFGARLRAVAHST